jgi:hypothetical protein
MFGRRLDFFALVSHPTRALDVDLPYNTHITHHTALSNRPAGFPVLVSSCSPVLTYSGIPTFRTLPSLSLLCAVAPDISFVHGIEFKYIRTYGVLSLLV